MDRHTLKSQNKRAEMFIGQYPGLRRKDLMVSTGRFPICRRRV